MKKAIATGFVLASAIACANAALAKTPYGIWMEDESVTNKESFNTTDSFNSDVDVKKSFELSKVNDIDTTISKSKSSDDDITTTVTKSSDDDYTSFWKNSEDNDTTTTVTKSSDDDYTSIVKESLEFDFDLDVAEQDQHSYKHQYQDAGHKGSASAYGSAEGHDTAVQGAPVVIAAGNESTDYYGPALVNTNVNQLPVNNLFVQGSNVGSPISMANTMAGRDLGPKGNIYGPVGNTSATVLGDVSQQSGAGVEQYGDSSNLIHDPMSTTLKQ